VVWFYVVVASWVVVPCGVSVVCVGDWWLALVAAVCWLGSLVSGVL
jgi:hypothetical protein